MSVPLPEPLAPFARWAKPEQVPDQDVKQALSIVQIAGVTLAIMIGLLVYTTAVVAFEPGLVHDTHAPRNR